MRNLKRALSLALASVMLVGMMVVGTSAASYPDVDSNDNTEAIAVLNAVEVMIGNENGEFEPDKNVTRNEMAVILAKLILGGDADKYVGSHPFTDVPSWADKYVAACYNEGIVAGRGEGIYDGNAVVTAQEAAAMTLRVLGYEKLEQQGTNWAQPVVAKANEIRLFKDVGSSATAPMNRNQVAQLALNALKADMVITNSGSNINLGDIGTITTDVKYDKVAEDGKTINYNKADTDSDDYKYRQLCEELYGKDLELKDNGVYDDLERPASVWEYKKEEVVKVADEADYTFVLDDDYTGDALSKTLEDLTNKDDLNYTTNTVYAVNGVKASMTANHVAAVAKYGTVLEVYVDNKNVERVVSYYYTLDKITDVDYDVKDSDAKKGVSCYVEFKNAGTINDDKIAGFNSDTYEKDVYVAIIEKDDEIIDSFIPEVEETSIDTVKDGKYLTAGGTKYYPGAGYANSAEKIALGTSVSTKADDSYAIYLDKEGNMLGLKEIEGSAADLGDVYYVDSVYEGVKTGSASGLTDHHYAQLVALSDGTISQVELELQDKATKDSTAKTYVENATNYKGSLVTISDKEWTNAASSKFKKDNDKFDLELWNHSVNDDYDVYTAVGFFTGTGETELKADAVRISATTASENGAGAAPKTFRLNASTQYVFAEDTGDDLEVNILTGGVAYKFNTANLGSGADKAIVVTEADKAYALYMIIPCKDSKQSSTFSEDVIYIHSVSTEKGDGYIEQEVYLADGTKETWQIDDGESMTADTFYKYDTNDDGFIELEVPDDKLDVTKNYVWDDEEGYVLKATVEKGALTDGLLTIKSGSFKVEDINVDGAKFVDLHDKDVGYENSINSLSRLMDLLDDSKVVSATVSMNVSKDGVPAIFLITADKAAAPAPIVKNVLGQIATSSTAGGVSIKSVAVEDASNQAVTEGGTLAAGTYTLKVTLNAATANANVTVKLTGVTASGTAAVDGTPSWGTTDATADTVTIDNSSAVAETNVITYTFTVAAAAGSTDTTITPVITIAEA